jgi:spermidine synthase
MSRSTTGSVIFLAGACTMIFEITGSRMLGPYFGASIFVWTSLIGIIMAGLSLGYWLGGLISLNRSDRVLFGWMLLLAGVFVLITVTGHDYVLRRIIKYIPTFRLRTLLSAVVLFGPASIFLGMILPYGAKLVVNSVFSSGSTVGVLYSLSTTGSITGTFLAGFVLLPWLGFANVLFCVSVILLITALLIFVPAKKLFPIIASGLGVIIIIFFWIRTGPQPTGYIDLDTQYNRVIIYDTKDQNTGRPIKILNINDEKSSAMFTDSDDDLVFDVLKYYRLAEHFNPGFKNTLMIGGSGYAFPKDFLRRYPKANIDVVEIDPGLTQIARRYFHLPEDMRLKIFHEDGRTYLNDCTKKYDAVFMDAYKSMLTVPYQLTTTEAVGNIFNVLNDGGAVYANIISTSDKQNNQFLRSELATYKSVFPRVLLFAVQFPQPDETEIKYFQNFILVGLKTSGQINFTNENPEIQKFLDRQFKGNLGGPGEILTDEYAPIEFYADKAVR